jgi:hypothetical protein
MKREYLLLIAIIVVGTALRLYRLDTQYIRFNDTFFRLTPALELSRGIIPSSYGGMPGISLLFFPVMLISSTVTAAQVTVAVFGIALIPLSYLFARNVLPAYTIAPLLLAFFVAINPTFVTLSKVMMWDIVVLVFLVVALITTFTTAQKYSLHFTVLHCVLLFFLVFLKAPNILFFPFSFLYILSVRSFDEIREILSASAQSIDRKLFSTKTQDLWIGVVVFFALYGLYLYFFPSIRGQFESGGGQGFFQETYYTVNLRGTLRTLAVPLNTPASNMYFALQSYAENVLGLAVLAAFQITTVIGGVFSVRKNRYTFFLLALLAAYTVFYFFFTGWSARYLCICIFILLFFLSLGMEEIINVIKSWKLSTHVFFSAFLVGGLMVSLSFSVSSLYVMEQEWGTKTSLDDNYIEIISDDVPYILERAEKEGISLVVSSYGKWLEFFVITEKHSVEIIDLFEVESDEEMRATVTERLKNNEKVWYIKGWPEGYEWHEMEGMYTAIQENYSLVEVYKGERQYTRKDGVLESSFTVYLLENG